MRHTTIRRTLRTALLLATTLLATGCRTAHTAATGAFTVVIDAGHGGNDQGAAGRRSLEKEVTLATARTTARLIRKHTRGVRVIQSRPDDEFVKLEDRAGMANFYQADLFISIHANSARQWAQGTETFIHHKARGTSAERLATYIQAEYTALGLPNRGVKTANFAVLRLTRMPAVLTEIGFISNRQEERYISSRKGRKQIARSICNAFCRYLDDTCRR